MFPGARLRCAPTITAVAYETNILTIIGNLTGDERDEIVVWDTKRVWIYTQDRPFTGKRIYAPVRNPDFNESNYRTTVSMPGWKSLP